MDAPVTMVTLVVECLNDGSLKWYEQVTDDSGNKSQKPANISFVEHTMRRIAEHCSREITALRTAQIVKGEEVIAAPRGNSFPRLFRG